MKKICPSQVSPESHVRQNPICEHFSGECEPREQKWKSGDVGCRMHLLSIALLQMLHYTPKIHHLKEHVHYRTVSVDQESRSSWAQCLSGRVPCRAATRYLLGQWWDKVQWRSLGGGLGEDLLHLHSGGCLQPSCPHWLLVDDICSCHMSLSTGLTTRQVAFSRTKHPEGEREQQRANKMEVSLFII